jgi:hypothetical protein
MRMVYIFGIPSIMFLNNQTIYGRSPKNWGAYSNHPCVDHITTTVYKEQESTPYVSHLTDQNMNGLGAISIFSSW